MEKYSGKVLIAAPVHEVLTDGLAAKGYECLFHEDITQAKAFKLVADCTGIITSTRLQLDKELMDAAPNLKWIGRMGSGMEVVDIEYARSKDIACFSSPEGNANAVGEHALGMLLGLIRKIGWAQNEIKQGYWLREENRGTELEGKTIGIIGFGHTGRAFAKKLQGFDMNILAYDNCKPTEVPSYVTCHDTLEPIFRQADIVSFHVPLKDDTIHYLNDSFVTNMTKDFVLVNTSRGIVVDTKALWKGIKSKKIKGACLDVWEQEPISKMNEEYRDLLSKMAVLPQIIVTPHIAGYTHEALYKMSKVLLNKITGE
jgi:D-3-phosphoglycerate dehydrogenase